MKTPAPFCCDINSGSEQERNEFKRLFVKASENEWLFNNSCYGFNYLNEWDSRTRLENINKYFNGNIIPLSEGIAILKKMVGEETPKTDGWISVKDQLPSKDGNSSISCLCWDSYHHQIRVLCYNKHHGCWDDESGDDYYTDAIGGKVTHWMPLPNPPKP